jgi:tetratricopeptide (TPR) repeat protein
MPGRGGAGNRGERRPPGERRGGRPPGPGRVPTPARRAGGLNLRRLGGNDFELTHPSCVREMELDYEEGIEIWKAGDPEGARDALRYALQGCGDNIWVHVALGRIALQDFNDPGLARGHFGYAFELANRAIPPDFAGRLPRDRPANRPFYEAIDGLVTCYQALGKPAESEALLKQAARLSGGRGPEAGRDKPPPSRGVQG